MRFFRRPGTFDDFDLTDRDDLAALVTLFQSNPFAQSWHDVPGILELIQELVDELKDGYYTGPNPSGTPTLDLTDLGNSGVINGAVFMTGELGPSGTGDLTTFLTIKDSNSERGYNSDSHHLQYDQIDSSTTSLLLSDIPIVFGDGTGGTQEGVAYREFLLELSESGGNKQFLSLDALQIWQEEAGNLTNFTPGTGFSGAHTNYLAYDLDAGGNRWIGLSDDIPDSWYQSDYRILIPDSFFINDSAHRFVTLYSEFGKQGGGWKSDDGTERWRVHEQGDTPTSVLSISKTATVPGGTADTAGEVISYAITIRNNGSMALTGITVTDPSVSDLAPVLSGAFNVGDTNTDGQLSVGEIWQYTASHTVTQDDIDFDGGGDSAINNTATADSAQTDPVSATASVAVERRPTALLVKTADTTSVDAAGDVINYSIMVQNTGNTTLTHLIVTDSQVNIVSPILNFSAPILGPYLIGPILVGDYNAGDTNENGIEDPGETFQFTIAGDDNQNGIEDPGETFVLTNIGDTNQNGGEDPGEAFQFYNAGDTNQNGTEDPGETFQFLVDHNATPVDVNEDGLNDGDINFDGVLNLNETWQYTVSYTVTQDDIDNGGVVAPLLTHDNTATATTSESAPSEGTVSVSIVQNPHVTLVKTATVPGGTADAAGEVINYAITITNDGNMTLTGAVVSDSSVSDLAEVLSSGFNAGDADQDGNLDVGETWQYAASHTVTQAEIDAGGTIDNTATATTDQGATDDDTASVTIEQHTAMTLLKAALGFHDTNENDILDLGETFDFSFTVLNGGNTTLHNIDVTDPGIAITGSTIASLAPGASDAMSWSGSYTVQQADIDVGYYENTAMATAAEISVSSGIVHVVLADLSPLLT